LNGLFCVVVQARAEGRYSEGLADVAGSRIHLRSQSALWTDPASRLVTHASVFSVDRGLSWEVRARPCSRRQPLPPP
jgi:hypothetical protein